MLERFSGSYRMARIARKWSNRELMRFSAHLSGDVVNVSGWEDKDKAGGTYRDYFPSATSYSVTNYGGERGIGFPENQIDLDLESTLRKEMVGAFDVVFCHTVLEHVYDVQTAVSTLCAMSRDILIIVVPFVQEQHFTSSFGDWWRFTPMVIERMVAEQGFTPIYASWNNHRYAATYVFCLAVREPSLHPDLLHLIGQQKTRRDPRHPGSWVGESLRKYGLRQVKALLS